MNCGSTQGHFIRKGQLSGETIVGTKSIGVEYCQAPFGAAESH